MGNTLIIIQFILFSLLIILFALKMEYHFSYFKLIYPDQLSKYNSFVDTQLKFSTDITDLKLEAFFPFFSGRRKDLEEKNHRLSRLGKKIEKTCYLIYIDLLILIPLFVINLI